MATAIEIPLVVQGHAGVRHPTSRLTNATLKRGRAAISSVGVALPHAILREMLEFFSLDELLVLEDVDVVWKEAIAATETWQRVVFRHERDTDQIERTLGAIAERHGAQVHHLELINCTVTDNFIADIGHHFTHLRKLIVSGCKTLTDDGLAAILQASRNSITEIRAVRCPVLTDGILEIANGYHAKALERVDFSYCRYISSNGVASLVSGATSLFSVGFKGCPKVHDTAVLSISANCSNLRSLKIGGSGNITDEAVRGLADQCPSLEVLDISRSNPFGVSRGGVSDDGLHYLLSKCQHLQQLIIRGQGRLTAAVLQSLSRHSPSLRTLDISGCRGIVQDPRVLCALLKRLSVLENLSVSFCGDTIEEEHTASIASECPHLKKLDVDGELIVGAP